jgi:hypothetical protein
MFVEASRCGKVLELGANPECEKAGRRGLIEIRTESISGMLKQAIRLAGC